VWWADFSPTVGHEQRGQRPCIIVSTAVACRIPNALVQVVPCTTTIRALAWHPEVHIDGRRGVAMCDQVRTISINRLTGQAKATLSPAEIQAVRAALRLIIDI
jgi:mRNA interferase MazF